MSSGDRELDREYKGAKSVISVWEEGYIKICDKKIIIIISPLDHRDTR